MIRRSVSKYYFFGTQLRYLTDVSEYTLIKSDSYILDNLEWFFQNLRDLNLHVTSRAASDLLTFKNELATASDGEKIGKERAVKLNKLMTNLRLTLDAEIQGVSAFVTSGKRNSEEHLLGNMDALFAPKSFENFTDIAQYDFLEAGRCIVFERSTAAAFHILRGTESNLRHYYKQMIKQKRIKSEMWGPIVNDLKVRSKTKVHVALNNQLDHIRTSFRNPTQHPEAIYDVHECQDLLSLCIDVNNRMFKIILAR